MQIRAAVARAPDLPFEIVECDIAEPGPGEVLVRVKACGICQSAFKFDPALEWAPRDGQDGFQQLTGRPGFQRMKAHGKASNPQRRVQTAGVTGVSERRDAARALEAAQCLP